MRNNIKKTACISVIIAITATSFCACSLDNKSEKESKEVKSEIKDKEFVEGKDTFENISLPSIIRR